MYKAQRQRNELTMKSEIRIGFKQLQPHEQMDSRKRIHTMSLDSSVRNDSSLGRGAFNKCFCGND